MSDIFDALARIRHEFNKADIKPPVSLHLESHEEGIRFLTAVRQNTMWQAVAGSPELGHEVQMADGSVYMELEVMTFKIRWPANRLALPDGSWRHV